MSSALSRFLSSLRSPRSTLALALTLGLAACSQGSAGGSGNLSPSTTGAPGGSSTAATATAQPAPNVPREPFTDAEKNFDAAKNALLTGYYRDAFTEADLYRAAVAGMLEQADPAMGKWNRLLSPSDLADLHNDLHGQLVGIGVNISFDPATGYIDVTATIPGTPADRAGIAPPDKIVTVDGKLYKGLTLHDAMADIRGKAGATVTLAILRGASIVTVPVVREKFAYDGVQHSMLPGDIAYVRIPAFNDLTAASLKDALTDVVARHARATVLDLRDNQGGSFDAAVAAAGEMVPNGASVVSVDKRGKLEVVPSSAARVLPDMPVAVLVDHATASSAELVTAALRELRQATVVGASTQGKWTVQTIDDLSNGYAIKYTLGIFQTPSGKSYDGVGLAPDVEVDMADDAIAKARGLADPIQRLAQDTQLRTALAVLGRAQ